MKRQHLLVLLAAGALLSVGCKEKKNSVDIIAEKVEAPAPTEPVRMQPYHDVRQVEWLGRTYEVELTREPSDSLPLVADETGQKFVDNVIRLEVRRSDGSTAIKKVFVKRLFDAYIDKVYRQTGILEGLVFDEVDGNYLEFAASVSLPQTDEYIPLEVKVDNYGNVTVKRDSELDTNGDTDEDDD